MRFFFHVADSTRDTFDPDWRGREFGDVEEALAHAQYLQSELSKGSEFQGYVIVSNDEDAKVGLVVV